MNEIRSRFGLLGAFSVAMGHRTFVFSFLHSSQDGWPRLLPRERLETVRGRLLTGCHLTEDSKAVKNYRTPLPEILGEYINMRGSYAGAGKEGVAAEGEGLIL
jgi:hypothetical protein